MTPDRNTLVMWPDLHWRLTDINDRHAHVTVFDHGARAGELTLDRATWDALTHHGARLRPAPGLITPPDNPPVMASS